MPKASGKNIVQLALVVHVFCMNAEVGQTQYPVKRGQELEVTIEALTFGGRGIVHLQGYAVFIPYGLPGQRVRIRVVKRKRSYGEARILEVLKPAPKQVTPPCPAFGICGGCAWQHLAYEEQLAAKRDLVEEVLRHLGGLEGVEVQEVLPAPDPFHYRNKMEFTFSPFPWRTESNPEPPVPALGLHVKGRFDRVMPLNSCLLQSAELDAILSFTRSWAVEHHWPAFHPRQHTGWARHLVLRRALHTGQIMVNLVTAEANQEIELYAAALVREFPQITTVVNNITTRPALVAFGERERVLYGPGVIEERLGPFFFRISAATFSQTNPAQAERLYEEVIKAADLKGTETVYDLYSGAGSISLFLARKAAVVYGIELIQAAVRDALWNAKRNEVTNVQFLAGDLNRKEFLERLEAELPLPQVVVTDPPRSGMHPRLLKLMLNWRPERIVYVSCNPAALARDLQPLLAAGYQLINVQPVDMFPHTAHVEVVATLLRA